MKGRRGGDGGKECGRGRCVVKECGCRYRDMNEVGAALSVSSTITVVELLERWRSECCSTCTTLPVFYAASNSFSVSHVRGKFIWERNNSWAAVNDTFFLTNDAFERHRVVFTVGTSIASVATAWIGYSLRHFHDEKVEQRLESIEKAMKHKHNLEHSEIKDIVGPGGLSVPTCAATAATTLFIGIVPSF
ncbi:uncharacterized protein [Arachis hypogaea]|uniref:uncharacterized protein n=1 Tax=Arachis hypogaea TaxID=3818 RepID=UPI000DEC3C48|nr:uncharacterized protein LOC112723955 [Arachis hypogaea]